MPDGSREPAASAAELLADQSVPPGIAARPDWPTLLSAARERLSKHGDLTRWAGALADLPDLHPERISLGDRVGVSGAATDDERQALRTALEGLHPWRKGPFELFGVHVDAEWRSDWKWNRIAPALGPLTGQSVLDVGCGNGYFGWRALSAGADWVLGVDPSVLFYLQHLAVSRYLAPGVPGHNVLLPVPFESLQTGGFDLALSMGVIYHRPDPLAHVRQLHARVKPGGRLLLESLVVTAGPDVVPARRGRYARMRNVSVVPGIRTLTGWLEAAGFAEIQVVDVSPTTTDEQRRTDWMTFESLSEALDPDDPTRTVEGHPAPVRAALLASRC